MSSKNEQLSVGALAMISERAESDYAGTVCEIFSPPELADYLEAFSGETRRGMVCAVRHYTGACWVRRGMRQAMPAKWLQPLRPGEGRRPAYRDDLDAEELRAREGVWADVPAQQLWGTECPAYLVS